MKFLTLLCTLVSLVSAPALAGEKPAAKTVYAATMSGMSCIQCKRFVKKSFSTLEGVDKSSFTVEAGAKAGTQVVTFSSTSSGLTKELAVKSLGGKAAQYVVEEFGKTGSAKTPPPPEKQKS